MTQREIIDLLPYSKPFLFVDEILYIDEDRVEGEYTFSEQNTFYEGHFKNNPITPGVILIECMAQIGLVSLGVFLLKDKLEQPIKIAMSSSSVDFLLPVLPGEKVKVKAIKIYFRFQKLKCKVVMHNEAGKLVCKGEISGMMKMST